LHPENRFIRMNNSFFAAALRKAAMMAGRKTRLLLLLSRLGVKLKDTNWKNVSMSDVKAKFSILGRLVKAYALGHYREIPWKTLLIVVAAIIYFVNPIDLIPDLIPVAGLTDDFGILVWVYNSLSGEIEKFLAWEQSQLTTQ
jgi:uncharacterized membrane protein YkvA (DUF1232 family)